MRYLRLLGLLIWFSPMTAQENNALDEYIEEALTSNLALQEQQLSFSKSLAALKEAKANYFPTLSLEARYTLARGGRTVEIPIGDVLSPLYTNLNTVNNIIDQIPFAPNFLDYPIVENESINFLRPQEQETKVRLVWPVFNHAIIQNHKIQRQHVEAVRMSVITYKRELVKEVKTAYIRYLQALEGVELFQKTLLLGQENLRTTESLQRNHKVTTDVVYAAQAQLKAIEQQLLDADKQAVLAKAYFNFLLNRGHHETIIVDDFSLLPPVTATVESLQLQATQQREEFQQLDAVIGMADHKVKLDKGSRLPSLTIVGDYGIQGTNYSFGKDDDFAIGSAVLSWDLYKHATKSKVEQSKLDKRIAAEQKAQAQAQIELQVTEAFYEQATARRQIELTEAQLKSAQAAFRLVNKKYEQGQANLLAYTEAQTRMTTAEQQLILAKYNYQIKLISLEYTTANYPLQ